MPAAYVLINSDLGSDESIIKEARAILDSSGAEYEIMGVYGVYDIVIRVSAGDAALVRSLITAKIRKIPKVQSTLTMMVVEGQGAS